MNNYYDVIIIGAGFAGLSCALELQDSELSMLILEKNRQVGLKACGHGVTSNDLDFLPKRFLNYPLTPLVTYYENQKINMRDSTELVSSIDRQEVLQYFASRLKQKNEIIFNAVDLKVNNNKCIDLNGQKIGYNFLIGADGSNSIIREYLNIPTEKFEIALSYKVPKIYPNFEIYLHDKMFGSGYAWIFPNKQFTSIGCGSNTAMIDPNKLNKNFHAWLDSHKIQVEPNLMEGAILNYDYRGYKFKNIYLIGDAAGLVNGVTGKGMYAALLSGIQVAHEIKESNNSENLILEYLKRKDYYESNINKTVNPLIKMLRSKKII